MGKFVNKLGGGGPLMSTCCAMVLSSHLFITEGLKKKFYKKIMFHV